MKYAVLLARTSDLAKLGNELFILKSNITIETINDLVLIKLAGKYAEGECLSLKDAIEKRRGF